ncbi:MAG: PAS domain-containing protein [Methanoregulaceae archaeon]
MTAESDAVSRILSVLKNYPGGLNIVEIAEKTGLNRMSAAKYLGVLTANESVEVEICGRAKIYSLSRKIPITTYLEYTSKHYCITDSNLIVVQLNEWIPRTVGMAYEDFIGRSLPDVLRGCVVNLDECRAAMEKALAGEASTVIVEENFRGLHKFFEMLHMPVRFPDGSHGMMAISQDITEKKMLEITLRDEGARLRALVEGLAYPVFRAGPDGILSYLSPRVIEYGFVPDDYTGRPFADLAVPEDRKSVGAGLRAVRESGKGTIRFQSCGPEGGRKVRLEVICTAQRDPDGTCTGFVGLLKDVTGDDRPARNPSPVRKE